VDPDAAKAIDVKSVVSATRADLTRGVGNMLKAACALTAYKGALPTSVGVSARKEVVGIGWALCWTHAALRDAMIARQRWTSYAHSPESRPGTQL
jgi:hypothetical protein